MKTTKRCEKKQVESSLVPWIGVLNFKMSVLDKVIYRFAAIPVKIPAAFLLKWKGQSSNSYGIARSPK